MNSNVLFWLNVFLAVLNGTLAILFDSGYSAFVALSCFIIALMIKGATQ